MRCMARVRFLPGNHRCPMRILKPSRLLSAIVLTLRKTTSSIERSIESAEIAATEHTHNILSLYQWRRKSPQQKEWELEQFSERLAGILAFGIYDDRDCLRIRDTGIPTVVVDYETIGLGIDCIIIDDVPIMRALCERISGEVIEWAGKDEN